MKTCPVCENDIKNCQCSGFEVGQAVSVVVDGKVFKGKVVGIYRNRSLFEGEPFIRYLVQYFVGGKAVRRYFPESKITANDRGV